MTWEKAIPEDEVPIKVGGNANDGLFKMAFQIICKFAETQLEDTVVFAIFHAKVSWANFKTALLQYKQQVNILKESSWSLCWSRLVTKSRVRHVQNVTCHNF